MSTASEINRHLQNLEYQTTGRDPKNNGFAYAKVPDWQLRQWLSALNGADTPAETRRIVIAARNVCFNTPPLPEALKELDAASEAFAEVIPWDDEPPMDRAPSPESMCSSYVACCVGVVECSCEASTFTATEGKS